jgi:tripartite-type tricarboxylate transporter receptor subunit TctC
MTDRGTKLGMLQGAGQGSGLVPRRAGHTTKPSTPALGTDLETPRMHPTRRHLLAAGLALAPFAAFAQTPFPERPLKLSVGFPPGTGPDVVARLLGGKLAELLKQQVVVDNRAGAGGQIAAQAVAKSPADGYSLLLGEVGSIAIAPAAFGKLPYDPARELVGIAEAVRADFLLVVPAQSPHTTLADFLKAARAKGDRLNFATFGAGTPGHFGADLLADAAGFKVEPIHYRATGDAVTAIVAGDVAAAFVSTALGAAQIKGGKMKALATTAATRSTLLPEVPTFAEQGLPKIDFSAWFALMAPAGTPAAVLDLLNRQAVAALNDGATRSKLVDAGFTVVGSGRADTERMLRSEAQRWAAVVKASGFKGD